MLRGWHQTSNCMAGLAYSASSVSLPLSGHQHFVHRFIEGRLVSFCSWVYINSCLDSGAIWCVRSRIWGADAYWTTYWTESQGTSAGPAKPPRSESGGEDGGLSGASGFEGSVVLSSIALSIDVLSCLFARELRRSASTPRVLGSIPCVRSSASAGLGVLAGLAKPADKFPIGLMSTTSNGV